MPAFFLTHWFEYFYVPGSHEVWYHGNIWGNVFVIAVVAPLGYLWAKSKFWPLNLIHAKLDKIHEKVGASIEHHKRTNMMLEEVHHFMHTGEEHPRVTARRDAGEHPTPIRHPD